MHFNFLMTKENWKWDQFPFVLEIQIMLWSKMENQKHSWKTIPYKKLLKKGVISVKKEKYNGSFVVKVPKKKKKSFVQLMKLP